MQAQPPPVPTLYAHSVRMALAATVRTRQTEYLVEDLRTGEVLADTFARPSTPMPAGSLLKPFLAYAHIGPFPVIRCEGYRTGCWRAGGHGEVSLIPALGYSCNSYFLTLAMNRPDPGRLRSLALPAPPAAATPSDLIGLTAAWPLAPLILADGYARLAAQAGPEVLAGLRLAASHGTAAAVGRHRGGVLAKTGTAPCVSEPGELCRASGDGLAVALVPALHPTTLVLVRRRGTTGAVTAGTAGLILTTLERLHAR